MVRPVSRSIYRTGRQSTKISTARGTGTSLFDSPRKRVLRGQLDDHRVRVADCGIVWILRVLAVEQVADSAKPRPLADQLRGSLDHHALQVRPRIRIEIDGQRQLRVRTQVPNLQSVILRRKVDLAPVDDVTH